MSFWHGQINKGSPMSEVFIAPGSEARVPEIIAGIEQAIRSALARDMVVRVEVHQFTEPVGDEIRFLGKTICISIPDNYRMRADKPSPAPVG